MRANHDGGGCFPTGKHYPGIAHLLRGVASGLVEEIDGTTPTTLLPIVSIDVETTGRDPAADRIVEIACVIWRNGVLEGRHAWLVNPGRAISAEASGVHGIRDEDVQDKPSFEAIVPELHAVLQGLLPLAYNAEFDRNFLISELGRVQISLEHPAPAVRKGIEWVDPLVWARELQKDEKGKSLGEVAQRLGIEIARAHRATDDAEAALQVMQRFLNDSRVPRNYAAFVQEQKRLGRIFTEERQHWRSAPAAPAAAR
jgi:DNA polymerase-3 subunit epsilon